MPDNTFTTPDYHFLLIAPNLGAEWLYAVRNYWGQFRPTLTSDFPIIQLVPAGYTIAVTVVCRRDMRDFYDTRLRDQVPRALIDFMVYEFVEDVQLALDGRAELNQPLGVPVPPTATPPPSPTPEGTPALPSTRPPAGFITQTPGNPPVLPTTTPQPSSTPPPTNTPASGSFPVLPTTTPSGG